MGLGGTWGSRTAATLVRLYGLDVGRLRAELDIALWSGEHYRLQLEAPVPGFERAWVQRYPARIEGRARHRP